MNSCKVKINLREGSIELEGPQTWVERESRPFIKALRRTGVLNDD